jgi:hypothetical protein
MMLVDLPSFYEQKFNILPESLIFEKDDKPEGGSLKPRAPMFDTPPNTVFGALPGLYLLFGPGGSGKTKALLPLLFSPVATYLPIGENFFYSEGRQIVGCVANIENLALCLKRVSASIIVIDSLTNVHPQAFKLGAKESGFDPAIPLLMEELNSWAIYNNVVIIAAYNYIHEKLRDFSFSEFEAKIRGVNLIEKRRVRVNSPITRTFVKEVDNTEFVDFFLGTSELESKEEARYRFKTI